MTSSPQELRESRRLRRALVLAAGMGRRLLPLTETTPKCLLRVGGKPLLQGLLEGLVASGIDELVLVIGYRGDQVHREVRSWDLGTWSTHWVVNPAHDRTNTLVSVAMAADELRGEPFLLVNGDLWVRPEALAPLTEGPDRNAMLVDRNIDLDEEAMKVLLGEDGRIRSIGKKLPLARSAGESIGAYRFDAEGGSRFLDAVTTRAEDGDTSSFYEAALDGLLRDGLHAGLVDVPTGTWAEIDDRRDLDRARCLAARVRGEVDDTDPGLSAPPTGIREATGS